MRVLVIGGTRFVGYHLTWRLLAGGHRVTLLHRGTLPDPFGDRVEQLRADRTSPDFERVLARRDFDAAVDFAAYTGEDGRRAAETLGGRIGHYVMISTGQVYLVLSRSPRPAGEDDYDGEVMPRPAAEPDRGAGRTRHVYGAEVARFLAAILGKPATYGRAFNVAQEETPTLAELVSKLAALVGSRSEIVPVAEDALAAAGLEVQGVSPFSTRWMSFLDPSRARDELRFHHLPLEDRKSTRLNSSHVEISYAVFCLKK